MRAGLFPSLRRRFRSVVAFCAALVLMSIRIPAACAAATPQAEPLELYSSAYIVMDAESGQVLVKKNADERHFPASVTKIMTLALALEACGGNFTPAVTVSEAAIAAVGPDSSMISLRPGEILSVGDLWYATLLESANDAANVLAEYIAGDLPGFVRRMNEKAAELGMSGTHFVNPSGYHDDDHYTTARDLALLTRWALTVPGFAELLHTDRYTMPPTNFSSYPREFVTDNLLLLPGPMQYDGLIGGKSGWTPEANYTMMEAAQKDGHTMIAVVLDCPRRGERCAECAKLLDYCGTQFYCAALNAESLSLPSVSVWHDGARLGEVALTAAGSVFLPKDVSMDDVRVETSIPRWFMVSEPFIASATLYDTQSGALLCSISIEPEPEQLRQLLSTASAETKTPWTAHDSLIAGLRCAGIAVLAMLLSLNAAHSDALRRKTEQRAIRRLRRRMTEMNGQASDGVDESP